MNEQEAAAYYQQHKDDPDLWGDEEPSPVPPGAKVRVVGWRAPATFLHYEDPYDIPLNGDEDEEC
jgi:hypothetical protein